MREWENEEMKIVSLFNFAQVWNLGKVCATKSNISEDSEGNGEVRKRAERNFGEKGYKEGGVSL